nr:PLP-dependent aminotransferase family protein [Fertoeibacter niger]
MAPDCVDYPSQRAEAPLRAAICDWLADRVLGPATADDVALTLGGQSAVGLIFQCCLRGERPVVLTEDLAYPGFRHAARLSRAEVVGVELDQHGLRPDALEAACRRHGPQVLCLTTEAQNPTAARMPEARRAEIAAIAQHHDLQVLEDDCYSIAESSAPAIRALAPERTWYVGSFSKSISAALRFGYIICPSGMGHTGRLTAQHSYFALPRPVSDLCLDLLTSGVAADLRRKVQAEFADRLQLIVNCLGAHDLGWQPGLPFVWLRLPSGWRVSTFARMAEAEGVLVRSADEYALVHGRSPNAVRLAIAGGIPRAQLEAALLRLARLLARPPAELAV